MFHEREEGRIKSEIMPEYGESKIFKEKNCIRN